MQSEVIRHVPRNTCVMAQRQALPCGSQYFVEFASFGAQARQVHESDSKDVWSNQRRLAQPLDCLDRGSQRRVEIAERPSHICERTEDGKRRGLSPGFSIERQCFFVVLPRAGRVASMEHCQQPQFVEVGAEHLFLSPHVPALGTLPPKRVQTPRTDPTAPAWRPGARGSDRVPGGFQADDTGRRPVPREGHRLDRCGVPLQQSEPEPKPRLVRVRRCGIPLVQLPASRRRRPSLRSDASAHSAPEAPASAMPIGGIASGAERPVESNANVVALWQVDGAPVAIGMRSQSSYARSIRSRKY